MPRSFSPSFTTAYILGVLLVLGGLLAAALREPNQVEWIPVILGMITFVSPFAGGRHPSRTPAGCGRHPTGK